MVFSSQMVPVEGITDSKRSCKFLAQLQCTISAPRGNEDSSPCCGVAKLRSLLLCRGISGEELGFFLSTVASPQRIYHRQFECRCDDRGDCEDRAMVSNPEVDEPSSENIEKCYSGVLTIRTQMRSTSSAFFYHLPVSVSARQKAGDLQATWILFPCSGSS